MIHWITRQSLQNNEIFAIENGHHFSVLVCFANRDLDFECIQTFFPFHTNPLLQLAISLLNNFPYQTTINNMIPYHNSTFTKYDKSNRKVDFFSSRKKEKILLFYSMNQ